MANEKTSGPQKPAVGTPKATGTQSQMNAPIVPAPAPTSKPVPRAEKRRDGGKGNKSRVGGTAVQGAKSTQPKQITPTNDPNKQQAESYNRTMRRRMEQMGTGPYAGEQRSQTLQEQRKKRLDRRKERLEQKREELRKSVPSGKISLGRRNTYFLIAVAVIVVLLIVLVIVLRVLHVF